MIPWIRLVETAVGLTGMVRARAQREEQKVVEYERQKAERAAAIEKLRQAGDRELARLQLMSRVSVFAFVATVAAAFFAGRLLAGSIVARVLLGAGWILLIAAIVIAIAAQAPITRAFALSAETEFKRGVGSLYADDVTAGFWASMVPWFMAIGLGVIALAVLVA